MLPDDGFTIDTMFPTEFEDIWCAEFRLSSPDEVIGATKVAHNLTVKVRFAYPDQGDVRGLLDAAYAKAREQIAFFSEAAGATSLAELQRRKREHLVEISKPFEFKAMT